MAQDHSFFALDAAEQPVQDRTANFVDMMIWRVANVSSPEARAERAESLALVLGYLAEEGKLQAVIDDARVDALAKYLEDDRKGEDSLVASILGFIGPRAARAVPILEAAHVKACAELPTVRSGIWDADAIQLALERITGIAPTCD